MSATAASTYELLLDDLVFELNEVLAASSQVSRERQMGLLEAARIVRNKIIAFDVDPSIFRQPLVDLDRVLVTGKLA